MVRIMTLCLFGFQVFCSLAQYDTIVMIDNKKHVGIVLESSENSLIINKISDRDTVQKVIGKHLVAYVKLRNGELENFNLRKWRLKTNNHELLQNRKQLLLGGGTARFSQPSWGEEDPTGYLRWFYKTRIRLSWQRLWYFSKNEENLSFYFAIDWLDMNLSVGTFSFWGSGFDGWFLSSGYLQPFLGATYLLKPNTALDFKLGGGMSHHFERSDPAFSIKADAIVRRENAGLGLFFNYDQTRPYGPAGDALRVWFAGVAATLTIR